MFPSYLQATNWSLRGSELIESMGLNRRFSLAFQAKLTWTPSAAPAAAVASNGNGSSAAPVQPGRGVSLLSSMSVCILHDIEIAEQPSTDVIDLMLSAFCLQARYRGSWI